jgi:hypothetical protein
MGLHEIDWIPLSPDFIKKTRDFVSSIPKKTESCFKEMIPESFGYELKIVIKNTAKLMTI